MPGMQCKLVYLNTIYYLSNTRINPKLTHSKFKFIENLKPENRLICVFDR